MSDIPTYKMSVRACSCKHLLYQYRSLFLSAPTSTAVRVAERYGLGLAGFLRDNRVTYYTKQDNI